MRGKWIYLIINFKENDTFFLRFHFYFQVSKFYCNFSYPNLIDRAWPYLIQNAKSTINVLSFIHAYLYTIQLIHSAVGWCYPRVCVLLSQTVSCQGELCPRFREVLRRAAASSQLSGPSRPRQFLNILRSHRGAGLGCLKAFYDVLSIELKVYICF